MAHAFDLEPHHQELVAALENMNCGVVGVDHDNVVVFANDLLLEWLGYGWDELVGGSIFRLIPEELDQRAHEQLQATREGKIRARISIAQRKDSTTFPLLLIPNRYSGPDGPFFSIVVELSTIQTAQPIGSRADTLRSSLERIALELQTIGLTADARLATEPDIDHPRLAGLTAREREVLAHLLSGQRVPAIAKRLHISPHTVRNHLKSVYRQLGVGSQSELIEYVRELGDASD